MSGKHKVIMLNIIIILVGLESLEILYSNFISTTQKTKPFSSIVGNNDVITFSGIQTLEKGSYEIGKDLEAKKYIVLQKSDVINVEVQKGDDIISIIPQKGIPFDLSEVDKIIISEGTLTLY